MGTAGDINTASGSKIFIGTVAANPLVDSYVEVAEVTNIGQFGRVYNEILYSNLSNRNERKFKGQRNDGSLPLDLGHAGPVVDPGAAAMDVALDVDDDYNFKITLNDDSKVSGASPTTYFFKAKVMGMPTTPGNNTGVPMRHPTLGIKSGSIVKVAAS